MNKLFNTLMASAALMVVAGSVSVAMAGDYRNFRGSMKDRFVPAPAPAMAGNCYLRADTGYGFAGNPDTYFFSEVTQSGNPPFPSGALGNEDRDGSWLFEVGVGCGTGVSANRFGISGLRADMTFGHRLTSEITGRVPGYTTGNSVSADVKSYTQMFSVYKDFAGMGSFTPYLGAGIGMAYHQMDHVRVDQGGFDYVVEGDEDLNFAWSLMAGLSVDVTDRIKLDIGYRYMDMGQVDSNHNLVSISGANTADPYLDADMTAHEIKFGLRYQMSNLY